MFDAYTRPWFAGVLGLLSVAAAGTGPEASTPLLSKGPWRLDQPEDSCLLTRSFLDGEQDAVVRWRALPLQDHIELAVLRNRAERPFRRGKAKVSVAPGKTVDVEFESFPTTTPGQYATRLWVPAVMFENLGERTVLNIAPKGERQTSLLLERPAKGFTALAACKDETLKTWGIDADEAGRVATAPEGQGGYWLTVEDYPPSALRDRREGTTVILYRMGVTGRVDECRTVVSSGTPALDEATCTALTTRARFLPARDAAGAPMAVHRVRRVVWRLP